MLRSLRWLSLVLVFAIALPVIAADEKKDKKKKDDDADPKEPKPAKLTYGVVFPGMVTKVSATSEKEFTVKFSYDYEEVNQQALAAYQRQLQQAALQRQRAMLIRNFYQRQQALAQVQQPRLPQNIVQKKTFSKDIDLRATDDIKVRSAQPPVDYDDKGNIKKYTKKELADLRGPDKTLPGYTRDFEALQANQLVKVYLAKEKAGAKKVMKKGKKGKKEKKEEDDDDGLEDESKPTVVMVVIIAEPRVKE